MFPHTHLGGACLAAWCCAALRLVFSAIFFHFWSGRVPAGHEGNPETPAEFSQQAGAHCASESEGVTGVRASRRPPIQAGAATAARGALRTSFAEARGAWRFCAEPLVGSSRPPSARPASRRRSTHRGVLPPARVPRPWRWLPTATTTATGRRSGWSRRTSARDPSATCSRRRR